MKCPSCQKEVTEVWEWDPCDHKEYSAGRFECPEGHIILKYSGGEIVSYTLYFERNLIMYKLVGNRANGMFLYEKDVKRYRRGGFRPKLNIPQYLNLVVKDDTVQVEYLVDKLKKLIIFS